MDMKNTTIFKYACALLAIGIFSACSDDENYDFEGDNTNRVYVNVGNYTVNSYNGYSFSVIHTPVGSFGDDVRVSFPVRCTIGASTDTRVTLEIDNAKVDTYNATSHADYSAIPSDLIEVEASTLTIPKGELSSSDSLTVLIPGGNFAQLTEAGYVLPIRITAINDAGNTVISTNLNTVYVVVKTAQTNVYASPVLADMVGTFLTGRSSWTATLDAALDRGALPDMFDGSTGSYWRVTPPKKCELTVDMTAEQANITGIRLHSQGTTYSFRTMDVYTSVDGSTWESQGAATLSTSTSYQYIKFYSPVTARYFKFVITGWRSTASLRMAEFDVYAN